MGGSILTYFVCCKALPGDMPLPLAKKPMLPCRVCEKESRVRLAGTEKGACSSLKPTIFAFPTFRPWSYCGRFFNEDEIVSPVRRVTEPRPLLPGVETIGFAELRCAGEDVAIDDRWPRPKPPLFFGAVGI